MAGILVPVVEGAVAELGPILARAGTALLGGAAVAGTASVSGDTSKDDSKAAPVARTLPRTDESCKKCPPEQTGIAIRARHHMNTAPREYQGCITGRPYSVEEGWSEEWKWLTIDFDGFVAGECLLQEAKGNYDQFLEPWAAISFKGFADMESAIIRQGRAVSANPPTRLMWYFQTPKTRQKMLRALVQNGVQSVVVP